MKSVNNGNISTILVEKKPYTVVSYGSKFLLSKKSDIDDIIRYIQAGCFMVVKELYFSLNNPNLLATLIDSLRTVCLPEIHTFVFQGSFEIECFIYRNRSYNRLFIY